MRHNKKHIILGLGLLLIILGVSIPLLVIGQTRSSITSPQDLVYGTGTIKFVSLEGSFFGIVSDDGNRYDPVNLPPKFESDGLRVLFAGEILDLFSIHMWGRIIRIIFIHRQSYYLIN
ncbi:MAG: hypothetical protein R3255_03155 [Candidatus Lokiarchaeia archaeon]|nr:hypothetical protein [Candidatus Lokiarchaeia archaeon]